MCQKVRYSIHRCNLWGLSTGALYSIRSSVIWPSRLSVVSESRRMFPKPHILSRPWWLSWFSVVLCGFIFCWAFTVLQALTSLLVLLCISTLRDEDRVTWEALITKPLALQSMTFGRHRNSAAAWPFLSDPSIRALLVAHCCAISGHVSVRRYFRMLYIDTLN